MIISGTLPGNLTIGDAGVAEMACIIDIRLWTSEAPCCKSTTTASTPDTPTVSAKTGDSVAIHPHKAALPSAQHALTLFFRITVSPQFE